MVRPPDALVFCHGDVAHDGHDRIALRGQLFEAIEPPGGDDDVCPGLGEHLVETTAKAARSSGHDGHTTGH